MKSLVAAIVLIALLVVTVRGDEVVLKNGDKLTGKVGQIDAGKMKFDSPVLGELTVDMANVQSFRTDAPVPIQPKKAEPVSDKVASGDATSVTTESGQTFVLNDLRTFNAPPQKWTGFVVGNLSVSRGNTETLDAGVEAQAILRRQRRDIDDRTTFDGRYNFGSTGTGDDRTTTRDNWMASGKYDRFFTEQFYGYSNMGAERDRIADLDIRLTPGVGVGYQWVEQPDFNFFTEAGLSYVYEDFDPGGTNEYAALRLAYHVDKKLNDRVGVFHNLEYLPSLEDFTDDYLIRADVGIQADFTKTFFSQAKVEWDYDSTPATGREQSDYRYLVGVGWRF